jgi:hypothetical protein
VQYIGLRHQDYEVVDRRTFGFNLPVSVVEGLLRCMAKAVMERDSFEHGKGNWSWKEECNEDEIWLLDMIDERDGLMMICSKGGIHCQHSGH